MPKKKIEKPQREMTKRQLSHWQRESRMQRIILIAGVLVVVAVLAIVGTGIYMNKYKPYQAAAFRADTQKFSMDYYIDLLAYLGMINGNPQQLIQYMSEYAIGAAEQNYFYVREAAKQLNVSVSDDEVKKELEKNKVEANQARFDLTRTQLLLTKLKEYFDKNSVPPSGDQRQVEAMFLESKEQELDVKKRIGNGEKFDEIAAQLSLEKNSKEKRGSFGIVPKGVLASIIDNAGGYTGSVVLDDTVFGPDIQPGSLVTVEDKDRSKDSGYWLLMSTDEVTPPEEGATPTPSPTASPKPLAADEVHLMAMLLGSKAQADEIRTKLLAGGEGYDFRTLAKASSQAANAATDGGDQGVIKKDDLKSKYGDEAVALFFPDNGQALPLKQVSSPIATTSETTKGGIWLLKVGDLANKPIEGESRTILINLELNKWQNQVWTANQANVETVMSEEQKTWAISQALLRAK